MNEQLKAFGVGKIIALIILVVVILMVIMGQMHGVNAWLIGGLAVAILLS